MKIKKRLKLSIWISVFIVMLMTFSLIWSFWDTDKSNRDKKMVEEMQKIAFERIALRDYYLLYREERASIQWQKKSEALRRLMETAAERFTIAEDKAVLQEARENFDVTLTGFAAILDKDKRDRRKENRIFAFSETEAQRISQVFLKSYSLMDRIESLVKSTEAAAARAINRAAFLLIFFFAGSGIAIVVNSIFLNRTITKRLTALNDGVVIIGGGTLDYHIAEEGYDELTDLARASNEMVAKLKQSYTSMENLQNEISERKRAEAEAKNIFLHQQTLLDALPDIIMEVDINKIYTWANDPGIEFFGKDVIGKAADFYFVREQNTYDKVQPLFNGSNDLIYIESWQKRKDGQERLLAWWCHALNDAQGNVAGALSSARDITVIKQTEEEIKKLNAEFEQRVDHRTAELTAKTSELERINKIFVDRELKMRELKARIAELEKKS